MDHGERFVWKPGDVELAKPEVPRGFFLLNTDGGIEAQQGQPSGEGSIGVVLRDPRGALIGDISRAIGWVEDHHVAEFRALIEGLQFARSHGVNYLGVFMDSRFVVNQISGAWETKAEYQALCLEARTLLEQFADTQISWIPREWNAEADARASAALDDYRA